MAWGLCRLWGPLRCPSSLDSYYILNLQRAPCSPYSLMYILGVCLWVSHLVTIFFDTSDRDIIVNPEETLRVHMSVKSMDWYFSIFGIFLVIYIDIVKDCLLKYGFRSWWEGKKLPYPPEFLFIYFFFEIFHSKNWNTGNKPSET